MKFVHRYILLLFLVFPLLSISQQKHEEVFFNINNLIPKPVAVTALKGKVVTLTKYSVIVANQKFSEQATYLQGEIKKQTGLFLVIQKKVPGKGSYVKLALGEVNRPEMYLLNVCDRAVKIEAAEVKGIVHGIQSLLQLIPLKHLQRVKLRPLSIKDYPRFEYRGMHLDVSRHFFPVSFIKKYIDYLTFHKFNTFHWHLTDDQGWRVEIKKYPLLTEVGAWRDSTLIGHFRATPIRFDGLPYGGFYTQEEIKDIIHYAAVRGITIIPEIDIPGHSKSAIAAYPELSTSPDSAWKVATTWGTFNRQNNVLAPNPATFKFLKDVFGEIADLFPSPYIHIGGDECSRIWWKADTETQAFIKAHGLKDETALQTYFIQQVAGYLKAKGKNIIGWDEILEPGLDTAAIIMNWRGVKSAIDAANKGHKVIMTPGKPFYFDFYQSKERDSLAIGGFNPLDSVYLFEPVPAAISAKGKENFVLGAQANVWTEYLAYPSKVEYMIFPRMTALSEVLWVEKNRKDIDDFKRRLKETMVGRYQYWNSSYFSNF